jgi:peptidoglycan/LPS O-acetylase OafA/YrhL
MSKLSFPALTGVRIVAAHMVYLHHFNPFYQDRFGSALHYFFDSFHIGVTIFFVLSGFLITYRYYDLKEFKFFPYIQNRFARIYPMYFLLTTFTFIFGYFFTNTSGSLKSYFLNITFLRGFFDDLKFTGIPQGWTLTVEESFYFLAPFLFVLIKFRKKFLILIPIFFLVLGFVFVHIFKNIDLYGFFGNVNFVLGYTFFGRITEFFIGIFLALIITKKIQFKISFKFFTYIGVFGIVGSAYLLSLLESVPQTEIILCQKYILNGLLLPISGIAPLFYGLIYEKTLLSKLLSSKIVVILGKSSYVFYLIHLGFFRSVLNVISGNYIFLFLSLNSIAVVLYFYVEKPLNHYFRKISRLETAI